MWKKLLTREPFHVASEEYILSLYWRLLSFIIGDHWHLKQSVKVLWDCRMRVPKRTFVFFYSEIQNFKVVPQRPLLSSWTKNKIKLFIINFLSFLKNSKNVKNIVSRMSYLFEKRMKNETRKFTELWIIHSSQKGSWKYRL